jgi:predicted acylesterase/phospholipase RssA
MKPKRLAIAISGAVSLGSYEAGVLYEVIRAIGEHNQHPDTVANPQQRIEIDVLTGASAGAMTAAIGAQKLLFEKGALTDPQSNAFYLPWVKDVDLIPLLNMRDGDDPRCSMLSSAFVENISRRYITRRYDGAAPLRDPHPASAPSIRLGLAMSNLNGVDYGQLQADGNRFNYTRFQDDFRCKLTSDNAADDTVATWEQVRAVAVSSGAFPFAFRVQEVCRRKDEFDDGAEFPCAPPNMAYMDGGVFQNQPLGLAKELVNEIDNHRDDDSRFFLFVSPDAMKSNMSRDFRARQAFLLATGLQLIKSVFHQARYQDWVRAHEINLQVRAFDEQAAKLKEVFVAGDITSASLLPVNGPLLTKLFAGDQLTLNKERNRLRDQFKVEVAELRALPDVGAADAWIDAILILETAAGLRHREHMEILTITASDDELCSELFFAFGGFFEQRFRQHDYDCGRTKARAAIAQWNNSAIGPIRYAPADPLPALNPKLPKTKMEDVDEDKREELRDRILDRADDMLEAAGLGQPIRWAAKTFFVKPKLDGFFKL